MYPIGLALILRIFVIAGMGVQVMRPAAAAPAWLGPVDPISQPHGNPAAMRFMELFRPGTGWDKTAAHIQALKLSTQFLRWAPEDELATVIQYLNRHHIALAMEAFMLTATARCGDKGVESYATPHAMDEIAERVSRLGGVIAYAAMDEPIHFGHFAVGPLTCQDPVADLAAQMAPNVRVLKTAFPAIQFGDIEPLNIHTEGRIADILAFAQAFQTQTGEPLAFVHADIIWATEWRAQLTDWRQKLHAANIRLGIIIDGDGSDGTDIAWADHAVARYQLVMDTPELRPDEVIFQSWMPHPTRMVPEDAEDTLTSIVRRSLEGANRRAP